jgi:lysophospholipase L1-like esterase
MPRVPATPRVPPTPRVPAMPRVAVRLLAAPALVAAVWAAALVTAPAANATAVGYVALGDSYASGVGTRSYDYDSSGCQRSRFAYPVLDAARLGAPLSFAACGGATVSSVLTGQLGTLNAQTGYVTVTVGGNDAGFSGVINQCARPWPYNCTNNINAANSYIRNTLPGTLDNLYTQIRNRAPNARVVVVGYPRLFNGEQCNLLSRISGQEQSALNSTADLLAGTIAGRAAAHGFGFADARAPWTHHAICDDQEWLNGLSNPTSESYHPNRAGQSAYADEALAALTAQNV